VVWERIVSQNLRSISLLREFIGDLAPTLQYRLWMANEPSDLVLFLFFNYSRKSNCGSEVLN